MISRSKNPKPMRVSVKTHPNGYSLEFDGQQGGGFMYHDLKNLLRGFMVHIGMGITDQLNMDEIESFIEASLRCADVVKNQKQIERLQIDLKVMTGQRNSLAGRVIKERERSIRLAEAMWKMREEFKANKEVYSRIHDIVHGTETLKHLTLQDLIKQKNEE